MKTLICFIMAVVYVAITHVMAQNATLETFLKSVAAEKLELNMANDAQLEASLSPLVQQLKTKKIVGIGEDTHGTSEYYKLRFLMTKKLIMEGGFNMVILENPYDDIERLNQNLETGMLPILMQRHLFSIYQTQEMHAFLNWLKVYNQTHENKVKFKGFDDSYWVMHHLLREALSEVKDEAFLQLLAKAEDYMTLEIEAFYEKYPLPPGEQPVSEFVYNIQAFDAIEALESKVKELGVSTAYTEELFHHAKTSYQYYKDYMNGITPSRDATMARRISYMAKDPSTKAVVWGHNAHISNVVIIDDEIGKMGRDLKAKHGTSYVSVGLSSLQGSYSYITNKFINDNHEYKDTLERGEYKFQPEVSWEQYWATLSETPYVIPMHKLPKLKTLKEPIPLKLVGYGKEEEGDYYKLNPQTMFDYLIFMRSSTATKAVRL